MIAFKHKTSKTPKTHTTSRRASQGATTEPLTPVFATDTGKKPVGRLAGSKGKKAVHEPTRGLRGRMAPPTGTPAPASLKKSHLGTGSSWKWLQEQLKPIVGQGVAHLAVTDIDVHADQPLELQGDALRIWSETIRTLAEKGKADAARRLLGMCEAQTRLAVFEVLLPSDMLSDAKGPDCLLAMANNESPTERGQFVDLLHGTLQQAVDAKRIDLAFSLVSYLPPAKRARWLLRLETVQAAPVSVPLAQAGGHRSLTLTKGDIDDDTWFLVQVALQDVVSEQCRRQGTHAAPPVLEIFPDKICTPRPQMPSRTHSVGFAQAIGVLLDMMHFAQACELLLMCSPLAQAYVFQALMEQSGQAGTSFDQLSSAAQPEVRALIAQAVGGCIEGAAGFQEQDRDCLAATLEQLSACQVALAEPPRQALGGAPASREMRFWRAYAACSKEDQTILDAVVPTPWLGQKKGALDLSVRLAEQQRRIAEAFDRSPDDGLAACEAAMQACGQWKEDRQWGLLVRGIVAEALRLQESGKEWPRQATERVAVLNKLLWIGSLTRRDLKGLSAWPEACDMVLRAAVEQAINADSPSDHLRSLVAVCQALSQGDHALERHFGCRLNEYLRQALDASRDQSSAIEKLSSALPPLISDPFLAADDVAVLAELGQEGAALDYLDLLVRTLTRQCSDHGLDWQLVGGWTAQTGDTEQRMRQRQVAELARVLGASCPLADQHPQLVALKAWLAEKALPLSACDEATRRAIAALPEQAWLASAVRRVWSKACGPLTQTREWMQDLFRLRQPLSTDERQAILKRLGSEAFAQWWQLVQLGGDEARATLEVTLSQVLGSEHLQADIGDWMVKICDHAIGPVPMDDPDQRTVPQASLLDGALARLIESPGCGARTLARVLGVFGPRLDLLPALMCPTFSPSHRGRQRASGVDRLLRLCEILSTDLVVVNALSSSSVSLPLAWRVALGLAEPMARSREQGGAFELDSGVISAVAKLPAFKGAAWEPRVLVFEPLWRHAVANGLSCPQAFNAWYVFDYCRGGAGWARLSMWPSGKVKGLLKLMQAPPFAQADSVPVRLAALYGRLVLAWWKAFVYAQSQQAQLVVLKPTFASTMQGGHDANETSALATAMVAAFELSIRTRMGEDEDWCVGLSTSTLRDLAVEWRCMMGRDKEWLSSLPEDARAWVKAFADNADRVGPGERVLVDLRDGLPKQWQPLEPDSDDFRARFEQYARSAAQKD